MSGETLDLKVSFHPESGLFSVLLENGARLSVHPSQITGKLGAALSLFRRAIVASQEGKPALPAPVGPTPLYDEALVKRFTPGASGLPGKTPKREITLADLEIDLSSLTAEAPKGGSVGAQNDHD